MDNSNISLNTSFTVVYNGHFNKTWTTIFAYKYSTHEKVVANNGDVCTRDNNDDEQQQQQQQHSSSQIYHGKAYQKSLHWSNGERERDRK